MSSFGEKLHGLLAKLKGGEELAQHEVETLVQEFLDHVKPEFATFREEVVAELTNVVTELKAEVANALALLKGGLASADAPQGDSGDVVPAQGEIPPVADPVPAQPAE